MMSTCLESIKIPIQKYFRGKIVQACCQEKNHSGQKKEKNNTSREIPQYSVIFFPLFTTSTKPAGAAPFYSYVELWKDCSSLLRNIVSSGPYLIVMKKTDFRRTTHHPKKKVVWNVSIFLRGCRIRCRSMTLTMYYWGTQAMMFDRLRDGSQSLIRKKYRLDFLKMRNSSIVIIYNLITHTRKIFKQSHK